VNAVFTRCQFCLLYRNLCIFIVYGCHPDNDLILLALIIIVVIFRFMWSVPFDCLTVRILRLQHRRSQRSDKKEIDDLQYIALQPMHPFPAVDYFIHSDYVFPCENLIIF